MTCSSSGSWASTSVTPPSTTPASPRTAGVCSTTLSPEPRAARPVSAGPACQRDSGLLAAGRELGQALDLLPARGEPLHVALQRLILRPQRSVLAQQLADQVGGLGGQRLQGASSGLPPPAPDHAANHRQGGHPGLGADNHAMTRIREEVSIAAPRRAVWAAVHEDLNNTQRWAGYVRHAQALPGKPVGARRVRY